MNRKMSLRDSYAAKIKREGFHRKPKAPRKGPGAPKPRKAMKRVSTARAIAAKVYTAKRRVFLAENPMCQAGLDGCQGAAVECHHKAGRHGKNFLDVSTFVALCSNCHLAVHASPNKARSLGLLK